jgi:uncharacterized repeat protein (TIGR04138 family)
MEGKDFNEVVRAICRDDPRYAAGAYHFMRHALDYTVKEVHKADPNRASHHISGAELSDGARIWALDQYGPMAFTLLREWGIQRTDDFGEIVFNLIEYQVFGKTDDDKREDFTACFDFHQAFVAPFLPATPGHRSHDAAVPAPRHP